jgi:hypothetical protein
MHVINKKSLKLPQHESNTVLNIIFTKHTFTILYLFKLRNVDISVKFQWAVMEILTCWRLFRYSVLPEKT